nr:50S ribosomal protein L3 [Saprospiraceae bacterium]
MNGLIGRKIGMTSIFNEFGQNVACTVVEAGPNVISQIKSEDMDGYSAFQLAFGKAKARNTSNGLQGHLDKVGTGPKKIIREFRNFNLDKALGDEVRVEEVFSEGDKVNAVGVTKGKGFQGVVKRHGFKGVGDATHGQHNRQRHPGSIGAGSDPSKVFKGMRMGGRTGGDRVKVKNLRIVKILADQNLLLIKGAIPGHKGAYVLIEK